MKDKTEKMRSLFTAEEDNTEKTFTEPENKLYRWFKGENYNVTCKIMAGVYVLIGVFGLLGGNTGGSFFFLAMAPWMLVLGAAIKSDEKKKKEKEVQNKTKEM
ncbi:hypothetical protein [Ruminococcus sp.]|uniref:hypothetical protein n=1 Tax=Ruminococcus sp. TaxID=41978 RepID=UPI0025CDD342|nr:hypothetical protein [Ruminococcus sp.]MBQ8965010.1 hypothetical protein [Ruminococcus sp.]